MEVMFNDCYGGFSLSKAAMQAYDKETNNDDADQQDNDDELGKELGRGRDIPRHDATMIRIVKRMGQRANGPYADIQITTIPAKFANHYRISEYDGEERVVIQYDFYKVDTVKAILKDELLMESERIARAIAVLDDEAPD